MDGPPHGLRDRGVGGVGKIPLSIVTETRKVNKNVPFSELQRLAKLKRILPSAKFKGVVETNTVKKNVPYSRVAETSIVEENSAQ